MRAERHPGADWLGPFLVIVLIAKLTVLFILGPVIFPDTANYVNLGQDILDSADWLDDGGFGVGALPFRLSRPYGYPLAIAAAKLVAGPHFGLVLGTLQTLASVAVLGLVGQVCRRLIPLPLLQAGLLGLSALSGFALFDPAVLTDSFYATLFIAVLLTLALQMADASAPRATGALWLGVAWAASLTLRDVGLYHTMLPLAGVILVAHRHRLGGLGTGTLAAAFLLPVIALVAGVTLWNLHRTGHAFFSIAGGINWLWPEVNMADGHLADSFACADPVCRIAQRYGMSRGWPGAKALADHLAADFGLDPLAFGRVTLAHFLEIAAAHPVAYLWSVVNNVQFDHLADLVFDPLENLNEFCRLHSALGQRVVPALRELFRAVARGDVALLPLIVVAGLAHMAAIAGLVVFALLTPLRALFALRSGRADGLAVLFLWGVSVAFIVSYALVHMEMRHALPAVPLILIATGWTIAPWWCRVMREKGERRAQPVVH
jgi:hypothetical protein